MTGHREDSINKPGILHIITPEYSPTIGGIADHTKLLADGLRPRGWSVRVWCLGKKRSPELIVDGKKPVGLGSSPWAYQIADRQIRSDGGSILLQWVPQAYGFAAMNLPFCLWVWSLARRGIPLYLMAHEVYVNPRKGTWKQRIVGWVQFFLVGLLLRRACYAWGSTIHFCRLLRGCSVDFRPPIGWLPVFSNVPVIHAPGRIKKLRDELLVPNGEPLLGHFSTFNPHHASLLKEMICRLSELRSSQRFILIGKNSRAFLDLLAAENPQAASRCTATGGVSLEDLSIHLQSCDLMLQPYAGGVNSRQGSVMACLGHGLPVATTRGWMTEDVWKSTENPFLLHASRIDELCTKVQDLISSPGSLHDMGERALESYNTFLP